MPPQPTWNRFRARPNAWSTDIELFVTRLWNGDASTGAFALEFAIGGDLGF